MKIGQLIKGKAKKWVAPRKQELLAYKRVLNHSRKYPNLSVDRNNRFLTIGICKYLN